MSDVHKFLKELRKKRGLSLREAAERSGLSHSYISSLETGTHPGTKAPISPSPESLKRLASAYNFEYEQLMILAGYIEEPKEESFDEFSDDINKLSFEELFGKWDMQIDGVSISEEEARGILAFVRANRAVTPPKVDKDR